MNIYYIRWLRCQKYYFTVVVIASTEDEALECLYLGASYDEVISSDLIGVCTNGATVARIVCQEEE